MYRVHASVCVRAWKRCKLQLATRVLAIALSATCQAQDVARGVIRPIPRPWRTNGGVQPAIGYATPKGPVSQYSSVPDTSHSGSPVQQDSTWTIGVLDGRDVEIFGSIVDLAVDSRGDVFILDRHALTVRWFQQNGHFKGIAGRSGGGPGEFRAPAALWLTDDGRLHVLDRALRRLSVFDLVETGFTLAATISFQANAMDFCERNGSYYALAPDERGLIAVLRPDGKTLRSFGEVPASIPPKLDRHRALLQELQNRGRLVCTDEAMVVVREQTPRVTAYSYSGERLWDVVLPDYHERTWVLVSGGRGLEMAPDPETEKVHTARFAAALGTDTVVVSLSVSGLSGLETAFDVRFLSLSDGRQVGRTLLSDALVARRGPLSYGLHDTPFPQVVITKFAKRGR